MKLRVLRLLSITLPKLLGGLGTFGLNLLLMRRMTAADLGSFAILLACVLLIDAIAGSAIDLATIKLGSAGADGPGIASVQIEKHAFLAKAFAGLATLALLPVAKSFLWSMMTGKSTGGELLYLACTAAIGLLLVRSLQVHVQLQHDFLSYGLLDSAHLLLRLGLIGVCFWWNWVTPAAILACYAIAPLALILGWAVSQSSAFFAGRLIQPEVFRLLFRNVQWLVVTFSLSAVISRMDLFLVSRWSSLQEAGIYAGGQGLAMIPQLLGLYISVVFGPKIMPKIAQGEFFNYFRVVQSCLLIAAFAGLVLFALLWQPLSSILLPAKFLRSSEVIRALIPGALAGFVTFPLTLSFIMFVRPRFLFTMDCLAVPFLFPAYYFAITTYGAVGAAWTSTAAAVIRATVAQVMAWRWAQADANRRASEAQQALAEA